MLAAAGQVRSLQCSPVGSPFALPGLSLVIEEATALAWNPSLPGAKIEDTVVTTSAGIELLTVDPAWPTVEVDGRLRPDVLVRT